MDAREYWYYSIALALVVAVVALAWAQHVSAVTAPPGRAIAPSRVAVKVESMKALLETARAATPYLLVEVLLPGGTL